MPKVDNGLPIRANNAAQNVIRQKNVQVMSQRISPLPEPTPTVTNYNNQIFARSQLSIKLTTTPDAQKWRPPTQYRSLFALAELKGFDYTAKVGGSVFRFWGNTPMAGSVGPGVQLLYWTTVLSGGIYTPDVSPNLVTRVETECLAKLKEGAFNLAADLVELPKTIDQIATTALRVAYAWKATSVGNYKTAAKILFGTHSWKNSKKSVSDQWLSWQYGWKPLLADIYSGVELVKASLNKSPTFCSAHRKVTEAYGFPPKASGQALWTVTGSADTGCEVDLWASVSSSWLTTLDSIGFVNPYSLIWEELPFSFVIDWLLPVGTFLSALSAPVGLTFKGGVQVTKSWTDMTIECCVQSQPLAGYLPKVRVRNVCLWRKVYASWPLPTRPYIKSPFSSTHASNAIALLTALR